MRTQYLYDDVTGACIAEFDENGDAQVEYTANPQTGELISENHGGQEVYHRYDGEGNTRQTTDSNGNVRGEATYSAFGETVAESGDMKTTYRFRGQRGNSTDPLTGYMSYMSKRNQAYSPSLGRVLSVVGLTHGYDFRFKHTPMAGGPPGSSARFGYRTAQAGLGASVTATSVRKSWSSWETFPTDIQESHALRNCQWACSCLWLKVGNIRNWANEVMLEAINDTRNSIFPLDLVRRLYSPSDDSIEENFHDDGKVKSGSAVHSALRHCVAAGRVARTASCWCSKCLR